MFYEVKTVLWLRKREIVWGCSLSIALLQPCSLAGHSIMGTIRLSFLHMLKSCAMTKAE